MDSEECSQALCNVKATPGRPLEVVVQLNGKLLLMEEDTGGSSVTCIGGNLLQPVQRTDVVTICNSAICTYSGEPLPVLGGTKVKMQYQDQQAQLLLTVV